MEMWSIMALQMRHEEVRHFLNTHLTERAGMPRRLPEQLNLMIADEVLFVEVSDDFYLLTNFDDFNSVFTLIVGPLGRRYVGISSDVAFAYRHKSGVTTSFRPFSEGQEGGVYNVQVASPLYVDNEGYESIPLTSILAPEPLRRAEGVITLNESLADRESDMYYCLPGWSTTADLFGRLGPR